MKILLASANIHKANEMSQILSSHTIILPDQIGINFDYEETGLTFHDNELGKARELYNLSKIPVIADDSGLCVPALGGEPGVYSARYGSEGGKKLSDSERNLYLLEKMKGISDRKAYFVCSMVFMLECSRFYIIQETFEGEIITKPRGNGGFGYDPLFYIKEYGKTASELSAEEKNTISHRGKAGALVNLLIEKLQL
jgi:XTP/dITP diphosphohydrolase